MAYTNSPLVVHTRISPNKSSPRNHAIDTITIHCVVGQCTAETLGSIFANPERKASSNYGVDKDGRVGLYVEEKDRSWCSSSSKNDNRAITIEVASDTKEPYAVTDKAFAALIELVVDICKRNEIKKLVWSENKNDRINHLNGCNMTVHRDYANKSCPGTYLYKRHAQIAEEVNKRLGVTEEVEEEVTEPVQKPLSVAVGDIVTFTGKKHYSSSNSNTGVSCRPGKAKITKIYEKGKHPYHLIREKDGTSNVYGWVNADDIWELNHSEEQNEEQEPESFKVGDIVEFEGDTHYTSANAAKGVGCTGGKAKITRIYQLGKSKHPYHLVRVSGAGSTVYGWVDAGSFHKV